MARVTLTDVNKIYPNGFHAVKDFNLDIQDKEFMVFVGPSGCGKSTTLRMVAGLEEISGGTCQIGERVVNNVAPKDRDIAMVFQNYALYPHMSVYKNMAFGLKLRKFKRDEIDRRVMNAADILGIKELLERKPKQLSGGQRQRVALGRAIVRDPACFLFDEPLSNLDAKLRVEMRAELKRLHLRLQTTTIYVTHDQEEAMTLGDRICVMKLGITQQVDTALMTYWHPVNRFVASFVGTPPMNFMTGMVIAEGDDLFFDEGDSKVKIPGWAKNDMANYVGKSVVYGVRPEVFSIAQSGKGENATMRVKINVIEPLGDKMDVYMTTSKHDHIVARINATTAINPGDEIDINIDLDRVHYFEDVEDGKNICLEAEKVHIAQAEVMA